MFSLEVYKKMEQPAQPQIMNASQPQQTGTQPQSGDMASQTMAPADPNAVAPEKKGMPMWAWIVIGILLLAGIGVGVYFLFFK